MPYIMLQNEQGLSLKGWELAEPQSKSFGRSAAADVQLDDKHMSSIHFSINPLADGSHEIEDHGSANGVLVNDRKIDKAELKAGDTIQAGQTRFLYDIGMSTMMNQAEEASGKSLQDELNSLYEELGDS